MLINIGTFPTPFGQMRPHNWQMLINIGLFPIPFGQMLPHNWQMRPHNCQMLNQAIQITQGMVRKMIKYGSYGVLV